MSPKNHIPSSPLNVANPLSEVTDSSAITPVPKVSLPHIPSPSSQSSKSSSSDIRRQLGFDLINADRNSRSR